VTLMIVGGVLAVAAIVVVLVVTVFSGGDNKKAPNTIGSTPASTSTSSKSGAKPNANKTAPVARGDVTVAVLNGTTIPGLARSAGNRLQTAGFKLGTVTNAPDQARSATLVSYQPGHLAEARVVARLIHVGADAVKPIDQSTAVVAGQEAFVVVTVGADQSQ
jgi:LytR cell envelope-related transcriptional attenuator